MLTVPPTGGSLPPVFLPLPPHLWLYCSDDRGCTTARPAGGAASRRCRCRRQRGQAARGDPCRRWSTSTAAAPRHDRPRERGGGGGGGWGTICPGASPQASATAVFPPLLLLPTAAPPKPVAADGQTVGQRAEGVGWVWPVQQEKEAAIPRHRLSAGDGGGGGDAHSGCRGMQTTGEGAAAVTALRREGGQPPVAARRRQTGKRAGQQATAVATAGTRKARRRPPLPLSLSLRWQPTAALLPKHQRARALVFAAPSGPPPPMTSLCHRDGRSLAAKERRGGGEDVATAPRRCRWGHHSPLFLLRSARMPTLISVPGDHLVRLPLGGQ